jgi:hypothetical protein
MCLKEIRLSAKNLLTNNKVFIQNFKNYEESDYGQKLDLVLISH